MNKLYQAQYQIKYLKLLNIGYQEKKKIISIIYDNIQDAIINICVNKAKAISSDSVSLTIPNFGLTKLLNLPIIELMFKMKFMITVIIILI